MDQRALLASNSIIEQKGWVSIMAGKKTSNAAAPAQTTEEPNKADLQRRMDEARDDISQAVAEIKETVTNKYESVKESVSETLDWREQFRKHTAAWSLGALAGGYLIGSAIASSLDHTQKKGRKKDGLFAEISAVGEALSEEFSGIAQTILIPALVNKVRNTFGIDLADRLLAAKPAKRKSSPRKPAKKSAAKGIARAKTQGVKRAAAKSPSKKGRK
jgi:hypothetical protein